MKGSEDMRRQSQGFSLIEILIAIAVLGVVSMALLSFFSGANFYSSSGKDTQKADMAGQSVVEEMNACSTFEDIETKLIAATGSAWKLETQETKKSILRKNLTVDGTDYQARVTLDYEYSTKNVDGDDTTSKFNNYSQPELNEIYSPHNVVLAETDQFSTAVSHFYYQDTGVTKSAIESAITRDLVVDISRDSEQPEIYRVKASYQYTYNGQNFSVTIKEGKIEAESLEKVYILYNLLREDVLKEPVAVHLDGLSMEEAKKITLYFICQKGVSKPPVNYQLDITGSGNFLQLGYATNGASAPAVSSQNDIVNHKTKKRIATVTVDIYDRAETDYTEDNRIVRLQTSKGA